MQEDDVIVYEAAFMYKNLFIRTDILVKKGNHIKLIEVKSKYSQALSDIGLISKNFDEGHVWLQLGNGTVKNPYELLRPIFRDWSEEAIEESLSELENIADCGSVMIAYSKLQSNGI